MPKITKEELLKRINFLQTKLKEIEARKTAEAGKLTLSLFKKDDDFTAENFSNFAEKIKKIINL